MYKFVITLLIAFCFTNCLAQNAGYIKLDTARFSTGDQPDWKSPVFNDQSWRVLKTGDVWQDQGYPNYHGYAWYRIHVFIPSALKKNGIWCDSLHIYLAHVNDVDETYLNGVKIGKTGAYPSDMGGYVSKWPAVRNYCVPVNNPAVKWDKDNVIAIKVYDGGGTGGIFMGNPYLDMLEKTDGIEFSGQSINFLSADKAERKLLLKNNFNTTVSGIFNYTITDAADKQIIKQAAINIQLAPFAYKEISLDFPHREGIELAYSFTEKTSGKQISFTEVAPYILTPVALQSPVINGATVLGAMANHVILYKIPASGVKPITYQVKDLPAGLALDNKTGVISGSIATNGIYPVLIEVKNSFGTYKKTFTIKVGEGLALTPPMGWNSWNCWGLSVSAEKVRSSASALINKGLADYGWSYVNVDDGWQAPKRAANGEIVANDKFPDMKALGDFLHSNGLKFGVYSSPGATTCGGFMGSLGYEGQDAESYYKWGVDYLKYDLCSYSDIIGDDTSLAIQQKPYMLMRDELKKQNRDIIYSLCQYGIHKVWQWGKEMNGDSWRTTEDITDTWESMYNIGFKQDSLYRFAHPGGWNDPDMLILGMVGWGENLHPTRLTPYEQYTHISLWSMLSAPLLIGCDMSKLDPFTLNLLENSEVIAVDQDELGEQAHKIIDKNNFQVWIKDMADGSHVIGIFNINNTYAGYTLKLADAGIQKPSTIRDIWKQKDLGKALSEISFNIPPHGVRLIKVSDK